MRFIIAGAGGYIGLRLVPALLEAGHEVVACVRDSRRFPSEDFSDYPGVLRVVEGDFLLPSSLPVGVGASDAAFYLLHSLGAGAADFEDLEKRSATNFADWLHREGVKRAIFLGALADDGLALSPHLRSRRGVEALLRSRGAAVTVVRASVIVGSGSASFEIIRDLVEKLPVMIAPRWLNSRCQPVAVRNVIEVLVAAAERPVQADATYDLGGPEVMRYRDLLLGYARERGLARRIVTVPVLTPSLSARWLVLVTAVNYSVARRLVDSLRSDTVCRPERTPPADWYTPITYAEAVRRAFSKIAQNRVPSVWFDAISGGRLPPGVFRSVHVPEHGVLRDRRVAVLTVPRGRVIDAVWRLGGDAGWPSLNAAWRIRGFADLCVGGSGMRRGRRHPSELRPGDALDFWRVLLADKESGRLILFAEMRTPGDAWLEFEVQENRLVQTATFRPRGWAGRLYWYAMVPAHALLFPSMARRLAEARL